MIIQILYLINMGVQIYSGLLVVYALLSWFPGAHESFLGQLVTKLCEPYLSLFDRLNLNIGMVSFNVMIGILVLNLANGGLRMLILSLIGY